MWSEKAQDRTRACAEKAGMGSKVDIISEPEAAAIRILEEMKEDEYSFKNGDTFVVCDAGGG
jgi:molecular chaperone DnaK (HSP70)